MPINIDICPHLNSPIHAHVVKRNVRGTDMCSVLVASNAVRQSHESMLALVICGITCAVASSTIIAFEMRVPQVVGTSTDTARFGTARFAV